MIHVELDYSRVAWRPLVSQYANSADACRAYCMNHPDVKAEFTRLRAELAAGAEVRAKMAETIGKLDAELAEALTFVQMRKAMYELATSSAMKRRVSWPRLAHSSRNSSRSSRSTLRAADSLVRRRDGISKGTIESLSTTAPPSRSAGR